MFFARTDFSRIFIFELPDFFREFCRRIFLLIFVGQSAQKNPPRKSPAKSSKIYTAKIPDDFFLQRGRAKNVENHVQRRQDWSAEVGERPSEAWKGRGDAVPFGTGKLLYLKSELLCLQFGCSSKTSSSCKQRRLRRHACRTKLPLKMFFGEGDATKHFQWKKGVFSERGEAIQWIRGLVRISTGMTIQWRGSGHSLNRRTLKTEKLLSSSPSRKSALFFQLDTKNSLKNEKRSENDPKRDRIC